MTRRLVPCAALHAALWSALFVTTAARVAVAQVVPAPKRSVAPAIGSEPLRIARVVCVGEEFAPQAAAFVEAVRGLGAAGFAGAKQGEEREARVQIERAKSPPDNVGKEWYAVQPLPDDAGLLVSVVHPFGAARAAASLLQLLTVVDGVAAWPQIALTDEPDLAFRCFMVDMGRNPHRPATLRRIVDACWFYKVSLLQLHLTDDQLFSWPSRAYPKLRDERAGWTWQQFEALESYSQARGVTIVPEIDVPGHSTILRKRYPEVFGKTPTELATLPKATEGVQTLIGEMLQVFRATPYVHIGGDEAYGVPQDEQRRFVNRLNRFVKSTGRRALAWEGPRLGSGDDKVDTDVLHINWRTIDFPAQEMLDAGYEVVNAAWDPLYVVDHYPRTMFTAVPVKRCYQWDLRRFAHVNHDMATFAQPHVTKQAQGIVGFLMPWWEGREENVLPLCVPRLAAVAAAAWNRAGETDYSDFAARQRQQLPRLEQLSGASFGRMPYSDADSQRDNAAFLGMVSVSHGASQPVYGPGRLTNGIPDRFDHFLGYPTKPTPLTITVRLRRPATVGRVVVHERAVGKSHEVYEVLVSDDGAKWQRVGQAKAGSRGEQSYVEHRFEPRPIGFVRVVTQGCHGLTFPSFSRLCEIEAFAE
ncbi:MAG: family 20 glycosylhydrolase [Planctomycetota bacterium]